MKKSISWKKWSKGIDSLLEPTVIKKYVKGFSPTISSAGGSALTETNLNKAINTLSNQWLDAVRQQMYPPLNIGNTSAAIKNSMIYGTGYSKIGYEPNYSQILTDEFLFDKSKTTLADWFKYHR